MKIRKGFVSNSSSSSFIIGVAEVADINKFKKYAKDNNILLENGSGSDFALTTWKELRDKDRSKWGDTEKLQDDKIIVESFVCSEVSISSKDMKDGTMVVVYAYYGNEGDYAFYDNDDSDWSDIDYEKVYEDNFFDKSEEEMLSLFESPEASGLKKDNCHYSIGAARNG